MDYNLLVEIIENDSRSKRAILQECGMSYTGFEKLLVQKSIKVSFLETFCRVTNNHISRFFPDWKTDDGKQIIPTKVEESIPTYQKTFDTNFKLLLQSKDRLISEQDARIKELSELVDLFKTGKIRVTE